MSQDFINPNWHIIFIHYPLGLLGIGILIELFSFFWRRSGFRAAGRWMILLGALLSIPTVFLGLFALVDVARINNDNAFGHWQELVASSPLTTNHDGHAWEMLIEHMWYQIASTGVFVLVVVVWLACSDLWRKRLHIPLLVLLLGGAAAMVIGAWHGGEAVYRHGVGVQNQTAHLGDGPAARHQEGGVAWATTRPTGATTQPAAAGRDPSVNVTAEQQTETETSKKDLEYYVMPVQLHVTLAGLAVAVSLAALGLSIRRVSESRPADDADPYLKEGERVTEIREPLGMTSEQLRDEEGRLRVDESDEVGADTDVHIKRESRSPAGRFWLLAALVAATASLAGFWALADESDALATAQAEGVGFVGYLWKLVTSPDLNDGSILNRRFVHVVTGTSIVLLPLVMAGLVRWAPRKKLWLWIFAVLLLLAVAVQAWLGILLMFDTPVGPVTGFVPAGQ
jgi:uncharacterized membrane protein